MCINVDGSLIWASIMKHGFVVCLGIMCVGIYVVESGLLSNFLPPNGSIDVILGGKVNIYKADLRPCQLKGYHVSMFVGINTFRPPPVRNF